MKGWSVLIKYCIHKEENNSCDFDKLKPLVDQIDVPTENGNTPLHFVALGDNIHLANWLLENGATFEINLESQTPLHWACKHGNIHMIKLLLSKMTLKEIQQIDEDGETALEWLLEYEHFEAISLFAPSQTKKLIPTKKRGVINKVSNLFARAHRV